MKRERIKISIGLMLQAFVLATSPSMGNTAVTGPVTCLCQPVLSTGNGQTVITTNGRPPLSISDFAQGLTRERVLPLTPAQWMRLTAPYRFVAASRNACLDFAEDYNQMLLGRLRREGWVSPELWVVWLRYPGRLPEILDFVC